MVTPHIAARLFAATVLLGSVALAGNAMAKPVAGETTLASAAPVEASVPTGATSVSLGGSSTGCSRKVKVVYAGYGEADRAGCSVSAKAVAN